ncbi:MAG: cytochrome bd ubiquinol oxidase subunit [Frankiaceae bacterium]|nr:cytochrome bd ubiquinol oxidase subunit [Frankiaceae bacterium]
MTLVTFWFLILTVLWTGFFVLEGFDFGVGMLHGVVGRDEVGRRMAINTIGPLWDGNEVWLIVAAAGTFAAFPDWYATMFSGFYLVLVALLVALIARGISFEFRGKGRSDRWRQTWSRLMSGGSLVAPLLIGIALGNLVYGVPINAQHEFTGSLIDLLHPYPLFVGITFVLLCVLHGATYLAIRTTGDVRARSAQLARRAAPGTALAVLVLVCWTHDAAGKNWVPNPIEIVAVLAVAGAAGLIALRREAAAFAATTVGIAVSVVSIFVDLYPRVMVSRTSSAFDLTIDNSASGSYSLKVMTIVASLLLPVVLVYTAWTYYVFRSRISPADVGGPASVPRQRQQDPAEEAAPVQPPSA